MNNKAPYLILSVVVLLLGTFFFIIWLNSAKYNWNEIYIENEKQPYGGYILAEILKDSRGDDTFVLIKDSISTFLDNKIGEEAQHNYVYVGNQLYLDSAETEVLLKFVEQGNNAWIISNHQSATLRDTLFPDYLRYNFDDYENDWWSGNVLDYMTDSMVTVQIPKSEIISYECKSIYQLEAFERQWKYLDLNLDTLFDSQVEIKGFFNDEYPNFAEVKFGEGSFFIHTNPLVFGNYHLLNEKCFAYTQEVFSDLKPGSIFWDEENRDYQFFEQNGDSDRVSEGPLTFILSETSLKWAWYLVLLATLLYLLFGARRKQRMIPVLAKNENTSLEFSETISQLYMQQKDHRKLCILKMDLFKAHIREHYGINTNTNDKDEERVMRKLIASKSNISEKMIDSIFEEFRNITIMFEVKNQDLVSFHQKLEYFYGECK